MEGYSWVAKMPGTMARRQARCVRWARPAGTLRWDGRPSHP